MDETLYSRYEDQKSLFQFPEIGSKWASRDKRDNGLIVTVIGIAPPYIQIKRFNKVLVRADRWHKAYRPALTMDEGGRA